ncbi:MAG: heme exporter protein CcmB [Myxococcota bacterium]|jgi:heme exporter protein B|nr:heme exporter protein CcmB [Myxococcota bacterium]
MSGLLLKEFLLVWRGRARIAAALTFAAATLLMFSFSAGADGRLLQRLAPGFLWLAIVLASTLTLQASFDAETQDGALDGLVLRASPGAIFYAKALTNWVFLAALACVLLPLIAALFDASLGTLPRVLAVLVLGTAALSAPGTLYATLAGRSRAASLLLPLLYFPLIIPALVGAVKATELAFFGDPMNQWSGWVGLLGAFSMVFWALCGALSSAILEDG